MVTRSSTLPIAKSAVKDDLNRSASASHSRTPEYGGKLPKHLLYLPSFLRHDEEANTKASTNTVTPSISTQPNPRYNPPRSEAESSSRPGKPVRQNSVQTRYMNMLLDLDTIPRFHNILASFFCWLLLAGFIIFPGTFTTIANASDSDTLKGDPDAAKFLASFKNAPLLVVAGICCGIGAGGMMWLWYKWRANYVWLLNRIFLPGCLNSFAGLISSIINVYAQQGGDWSTSAEVTGIVTGACTVVTAVLFLIYNMWALERVKKSHRGDMVRSNIDPDESLAEKVERKTNEPALEPGSVV